MSKRFRRAVLDIETNGLLSMLLDYGTKPLVLKQEARLWCLAVRDFDNRKDVVSLKLEECTKENLRDLLKDTEELIYHNGVSFDAPMLKLFDVMDYRVGFEGESDTLYGKPIQIIDTLVLSKLLRQDRFGGHSVEAWGRVLGYPKMDFHAFDEYSDLMVTYCENDTLVQAEIYQALLEELGPKGFDEYAKAYRLELKLADLTVNQEHHGFAFDTKRAEGVLDKFNTLLEDIRSKVDPLLPPRPLNKGEQKTFIPPTKQFKINGDPTAHMLNFIAKIDAELSEDKETITFEGKEFKLPLEAGISIKETLPGSIDSLDHLKAHLLDLGWDPLEWKERDLSRDTKKNKLVGEKLDETIQRYIDDTLNGPYKKYRLELMGIKDETKLAAYINDQKEHYKIAVPVSPMLRTGTAKELCPNLVSMGKQAEFATDVVKYLTFKHRRNSVAGGKEDESGNPLSGYLSQVRADNRISTPADTNGANGGRYKHRVVCNIPRVSSPGGEELRGLFGCGEGRKQLGFDFSSLEARIQGHYVLPFPTGEELATSLIAEKPNDCFDMDTQLLAKHGWVSRKDITLATELANWYADGTITFETPNQIVDRRTTSFINIKTDRLHIRVTPNHRIILFNRQSSKYITLEADRVGDYLRYHPDCFIPSKGILEEGHTDSKWVRAITDLDQDCVVNYHKGSIEVYSENKEVIENLVVAQRLRGNHALMFTKRFGDTLRYQTSITDMFKNHCGFKITEQDISTEYVEEDVWCVSVNSTYVIAKKSDTMYVIGNCHTVNSIKLGITRDDAKSFSYASMYGAQADKLSKMLRISLKEAERLYVAYWEAVPALKELKDRVEAYWKKTGKQHILGIDNRKLHVRSPHSLINLLLQSAGALCVKYTIVGVARSLEEKGLLGNPFEDTFEDYKKKVYQMIVYHKFNCGTAE